MNVDFNGPPETSGDSSKAGLWHSSQIPKVRVVMTLGVMAAITFLVLFIGFLSGLTDPSLLKPDMEGLEPSWARPLAAVLAGTLIILPMGWVLTSGVIDLFAFFCFQSGLAFIGYFFLEITAWKLGSELAPGILAAAPLVILINAIGFCLLFCVMGVTYLTNAFRGLEIKRLKAAPEVIDQRLKWFLRGVAVVACAVLAIPMVGTGQIPFFSSNLDTRGILIESGLFRPLYNLGYGLMPVVAGGLVILCLRKPSRFLGIDGFLTASLVLVQLMSGNRLPLAIATFVTITLLTMENRYSRTMLCSLFSGIMILFIGIGGLTGLLRTDRDQLKQHPVANSMEAAFTGDNIIDVRDASWVLSRWDFEPLMGRTYEGGLTSMLPSALFPQKKEWHLGMTAVRIVGWVDLDHFGLRVTPFGEAFLNFGLAGVITVASLLGFCFGTLLRVFHLTADRTPPCLNSNVKIAVLMQMSIILFNTSDAFSLWTMLAFLSLQWLVVDFPYDLPWQRRSPDYHEPYCA